MPSKNKRILLLADAASIHTQRWSNALVEEGYEVVIVSFTEKYDSNFDERIIFHVLGSRTKISNIVKGILLVNFYVLFRNIHFINIHYTTTYGPLGVFAIRGKLITSVYGSDILIRPRRSRTARYIVLAALRRSTAIFATSKFLAEQTSLYTKRPIIIIPFGIDTKVFDFKSKPESNVFNIVCTKTLKDVYGVDLLLRATQMLVYKYNLHNIRLTVTGDGPDGQKYKALCKDLDIEEIVDFPGAIPHKNIPAILQDSDLAVFPSRSESYGVSILESMAAGVPTIATRVGGIPEIISNEINGILIDKDSVEQICNAILRLYRDRGLRQTLKKNSREIIQEFHSWSYSVNCYIEFTEKVLSKSVKFPHLIFDPRYPIEENFVVFHYPGTIQHRMESARLIRVNNFLKAFKNNTPTLPIVGDSKDRLRQLALLKYYIYLGKSPKFCYSESHTAPFLIADGVRSFDFGFADYRIYFFLKKRKIPVGLFIRDMQWRIDFYKKLVSRKKYYLVVLLQYLDYIVMRFTISHVFLTTLDARNWLLDMVNHIPISTLPPAILPREDSRTRIAVVSNCNKDKLVNEKYIAINDITDEYAELERFSGIELVSKLNLLKENLKDADFVLTNDNEKFNKSWNSLSGLRRLEKPIVINGGGKAIDMENVSLINVESLSEVSQEGWREITSDVLHSYLFGDHSSDCLTLLYAGGLGKLYPISNLIEAVADIPMVRLIVCCRVGEIKYLGIQYLDIIKYSKNIVLAHGDDNFVHRMKYAVDIGVLVTKDIDYLKVAMPMKVFTYLGIGIPILVSESCSVVAKMTSENNIGFVTGNDIDSIKYNLIKILESKSELIQMRKNVKHFSSMNTWDHRYKSVRDIMKQYE